MFQRILWLVTRELDHQRGDVPGWVLIVLMTSALVIVFIPGGSILSR